MDSQKQELRAMKKNKTTKKTHTVSNEQPPLIRIDESCGESLFAIVDFSIPDEEEMRRIIAKKNASGSITAVTYIGKVNSDRTCTSKRSIMTMEDVSQNKFWQSVQVMEVLYKARGAIIEIRNYDGKTIKEAMKVMKMTDNVDVWIKNISDSDNP